MLCAGASAVAPNLKGSMEGGMKRSRITFGTSVPQQHLTLCNAYGASAPLEILHVDRHTVLTKDKPLKYKECQEFMLPLAEGDQLDFKSGGLYVGTFHATSMPKASASLLLIPRRQDSSGALAFESHMFAEVESPQIAVMDAYHGNGTSTVNIVEDFGEEPMAETLHFNSVVAVNPGMYNIALTDSGGNGTLAALSLHAQARSKCVVMRVGGPALEGLPFPQELVVFPNSATGQWSSVKSVLSSLWSSLSEVVHGNQTKPN